MKNLVVEYKNSYNCSIGKKSIAVDYSVFTKETQTNLKASKFEVGNRVRITNYKNIFSKGYTKKWSKNICV